MQVCYYLSTLPAECTDKSLVNEERFPLGLPVIKLALKLVIVYSFSLYAKTAKALTCVYVMEVSQTQCKFITEE